MIQPLIQLLKKIPKTTLDKLYREIINEPAIFLFILLNVIPMFYSSNLFQILI